MAGDQSPRRPDPASGANLGWAAVGYLTAGIGVWGFFGWLADRWLGLPGYGLMIGMLVGASAAVYLIVKRMSG
jgi:ATP synthase protein I